jgi:HlyD family secretion protein
MKPFLKRFLMIALLTAITASACGSNLSTQTISIGKVTSITVTDQVETSGNLGAAQLTTLAWGTTGLIENVNVTIGQKVKSGDVLASLDINTVPADLVVAQSDLANAKRNLEDLLKFNISLAQAQLNVIAARKDVEEAANIYAALDYPRATEVFIQNLEAQIEAAQRNVTLLTKQYKEVQDHLDGDPIKTSAEIALTNAQMDLNELIATLNWYTGKPTEADYEEAKAKLDLARAALEQARLERDRVKDGPDPLELEAAKANVAAAQAKVNAMTIIAPFDGEIIFIKAQAGNSVSNGEEAIGIVNRDTIQIETQIDEASIAQISAGDVVEVTMDSLADTILTGKVTLINPIGQTVSGLVKYTVIVSLDPIDQPLLFGATAAVTIITSEPHTLLAIPLGALQTDDRGEYVMRVTMTGIERIDVISGDLSGKVVTLISAGDLKEGDHVQVGSTTDDSNNNSDDRGPGGPGGFFIGG